MVALLGACTNAPEDEEATVTAESDRAAVDGAGLELATALRDAGLELPASTTGTHRTCNSEPEPGVDYTLAFSVQGAGSQQEQATRIRSVLEEGGWEVTSSAAGVGVDGNFERDAIRLRTGASRSTPDGVAIGLTGGCVRVESDEVSGLLLEEPTVDLSEG